jgi:hypothetical protein
MKTLHHATWLILLAVLPTAYAQRGTLQSADPAPSSPPAEPPAYQTQPPAAQPGPGATTPAPTQSAPVYVYDQKPIDGHAVLMTQEQAQTIISRFKEAYPGMGSPRFLIYVNRELVDEKSGMKLVRHEEKIQSQHDSTSNSASTTKSTVDNVYHADGKVEPTLADKQTVRDVERLFGRPLRSAGASLADQRVAAELIADKPMAEFVGSTDTPEARKDREALGKITDVVIEILVSSKTVAIPTISGDQQSISIPDIQATAIRLKDSKILGQVASADITGRVPPAMLGNFGVGEISETTALTLMEDMTPGAQ